MIDDDSEEAQNGPFINEPGLISRNGTYFDNIVRTQQRRRPIGSRLRQIVQLGF